MVFVHILFYFYSLFLIGQLIWCLIRRHSHWKVTSMHYPVHPTLLGLFKDLISAPPFPFRFLYIYHDTTVCFTFLRPATLSLLLCSIIPRSTRINSTKHVLSPFGAMENGVLKTCLDMVACTDIDSKQIGTSMSCALFSIRPRLVF